MSTIKHADALMYRAFGLYAAEAAAGLFLESGLGLRFLIPADGQVDYTGLLAEHGGVLSGAERRLLAICASLTDPEVRVNLDDVTANLDERNQALVVRTILHAMGTRPAHWQRPERPESW